MRGKDNCPLCRKAADPLFAPFCSRGCRDRDLLSWLGEDYRVPVAPEVEEDDDRPRDARRGDTDTE